MAISLATMEKDNKPQENKPKKIKLRVGQFNVLNLVRAGVKFYGNNSYSEDVVNKKVRWIAHQLQNMDAGIVGFEEVFHADVLQRAVDESGLYTKADTLCALVTVVVSRRYISTEYNIIYTRYFHRVECSLNFHKDFFAIPNFHD